MNRKSDLEQELKIHELIDKLKDSGDEMALKTLLNLYKPLIDSQINYQKNKTYHYYYKNIIPIF